MVSPLEGLKGFFLKGTPKISSCSEQHQMPLDNLMWTLSEQDTTRGGRMTSLEVGAERKERDKKSPALLDPFEAPVLGKSSLSNF